MIILINIYRRNVFRAVMVLFRWTVTILEYKVKRIFLRKGDRGNGIEWMLTFVMIIGVDFASKTIYLCLNSRVLSI